MAANPGTPPLADRVTVAEPSGRTDVKADPSRLLSLAALALRLAREDLAAAAQKADAQREARKGGP